MVGRRGYQGEYIAHLSQVPMFSACSKQELREIAQLAEHIEVPAGRRLIEEGRLGSEFFVIVAGGAAVSRHGEHLATLGPGDFFGELALLANRPRNATITTTEPTEVLVLNRPQFNALLLDAPNLTRKLLLGVAERLSEIESSA